MRYIKLYINMYNIYIYNIYIIYIYIYIYMHIYIHIYIYNIVLRFSDFRLIRKVSVIWDLNPRRSNIHFDALLIGIVRLMNVQLAHEVSTREVTLKHTNLSSVDIS